MTNQKKGSEFEKITKDFFTWLLEEIGFVVTKSRVQKSGTQNGFDILLLVSKNYDESKIFIECKNYETDLAIGNILKKGLNLENNYTLDENDLFIVINPKSDFSNEDNSEKLSPTLNEKFNFSYYALDLSNGVKELFALNNSFYKKIYGTDVNFIIDSEKEINRFKNIIFSRKPFKKIFINEEDRLNFIGDIKLDKNYINRKFSENIIDKYSFSFDNESKDYKTLSNIIANENKIIILGNPGTGKTTELINLALSNWKTGEVTDYIPVFKSLRDFTNTDNLENYLPKKINDLNKVLLILDGIDEIVDIEYFKSKLNIFIENNETKKYKFIISCRTNIYNVIVNDITGFKTYFLKDLSRVQSLNLLKLSCKINIDNLNFSDMIYEFLKTPFQVEILANYIEANKKTPLHTYEIWHKYIDTRLKLDKTEKLKKKSLNTALIKRYSKKISLLNEITKSNIIIEDNLFKVTKYNTIEFNEIKKSPLLDIEVDSENYYFEHKNIQEYFAALAISELSIDEIKNFILIDNNKKTHPSLFNSITFLLNILTEEKLNILIEWFITNEPELLLKADKNRIENYRIKVFQDFFTNHCIEKSYWITTNNPFSVNEFAEFGDCLENYNFLIKHIEENKHYRIVFSAIELLSFFDSKKYNKKEELKNYLLNQIKNPKNDKVTKSHFINCIYNQKFHNDKLYMDSTLKVFKNESHKELNNSLLRLINNQNEVDQYFWFIKKEFEYENEIIQRKEVDNIIRGNRWLLDSIVIKLKNIDYFIIIAKYVFSDKFNFYIDTTFEDKFLEKCINFSQSENKFLEKLLVTIKDDVSFYSLEKKFAKIFNSLNNKQQLEAYSFLLSNYKFNEVDYFLASISNERNISLAINFFIEQKLNNKISPDFFRNVIYNSGKNELAIYFENQLDINNIKFSKKIDEIEISKRKLEITEKPQINFDLLFDKVRLLEELNVFFIKNNIHFLDFKLKNEIELKWYNENGHDNTIDISFNILSKIIYSRKQATFDDVKEYLNNEINIINEIKNQIKRNKSVINKFEIKTEQKKYIENWCKVQSSKIDFSQIMIFNNSNSFNLGSYYNTWKLIIFFDNELNLSLDKIFYLNSLAFYDHNLSNIENNLFYTLIDKINDKSLVYKKVIDNINHKELLLFGLEKHYKYAIENNLSETFEKIKETIYLNDDNLLNESIEPLYEKIKNDDFLLRCSENNNTSKCWIAIKILLKKHDYISYCEAKSKEYLDSIKNKESYYYLVNALSCLFEIESKDAINYYIELIKTDRYGYLRAFGQLNFTNIDDFDKIKTLFNIAYSTKTERTQSHDIGTFLNNLIINLSKKDEETNKKIKLKLEEIKNELKESDNNYDSKIFYINLLIDKNTDCLISLLSKPLTFEEALEKVEKIIF